MFPVKIIGESPATDHKVGITLNGAIDQWSVPNEVPVAFVYNRRNYAVMLATPENIVDYSVGFSLTEQIIDTVDDIIGLDVMYTDRGIDLRIKISDEKLARFDLLERRRTLPGNAGCGLCGLENADAFFEQLPQVSEIKTSIDIAAIAKAFTSINKLQPINQRTRSVHGAAWVNFRGDIQHVREDVGRHNALDKLLGALALTKEDMASGFVVMSSRCSYELVEKAARRGVLALASLSAPTGFALEKAKEANMTLYARAPDGVVELITS